MDGYAKALEKRNRTINLDSDERLRIIDVLQVLKVSKSTFFDGIKSGRYPAADGRDGRMPFWRTSTIKPYARNAGGEQ
ncbi:helix-turn-helix transcriptional regulator [Paraburkholderia bryophila]|uniref:Putative DNA-binding transcriptional regulator AlpA n=1 Tax=Paraburkholderia bryophila TaxID=420952 RepID=A0A7Y9W3D2_9BURK|nr:hypothetical protein [Paraburkholderia bryophila]NYH13542.1 putative DNA-binding transcriptional regulator AlpA [Paraburkholderia bryophila]